MLLLVLFFHGVAWQTIHVHNADHLFQHDSESFNRSETAIESVEHNHHSHPGECVICQLQQQFLNVVITTPPRISPSLESETASVSVFFEQKIYRSAETAPVGGRGPPSLFLS